MRSGFPGFSLSVFAFLDIFNPGKIELPLKAFENPPFVLPSKVDWSQYSGSIRDQGTCGSCVGFAVSAAVETQYIIDCKKPIPRLSPQFIMSCGGGNCETGMPVSKAIDQITKFGIPSEDCYPYVGKDRKCQPGKCSPVITPEAVEVTNGEYNAKELKHALLMGPVLTIMTSFSDFKKYSYGVYSSASDSKETGSHAVMIVGYDDSDETWLVQNFWGSDWGEGGYFRAKQKSSIDLGRRAWRFTVDCSQPFSKLVP